MGLHSLPVNPAVLLPFLFAILGGWAATFLSSSVARRFSVLAKPSSRRRHEAPTPLLGGLAIYLVLATGLVCMLSFGKDLFRTPISVSNALLFLASLTVIFVTGILDDWMELRARHKFLGQAIAAGMALFAEDSLREVFAAYGVSPWVGYPVALLWIVGATNAMNLIDGMDGLCSGVAAIVAVGICVLVAPLSAASFTVAVLAGASLGFFIHNFPPAKIFLGDSGSLLLGFSLSALSLKIPFHGNLFLSMGVLALIFGIPILDTFLAIYRRVKLRRPLFKADRGHLHHRLEHLGIPTRAATLTLLALQTYAVLTAVSIHRGLPQHGWAPFLLALPFVALFLAGLKYTEYLVSYQSARLSYLFLKDELDRLADTERVTHFLREQIRQYEENRTPFSVVIMDCSSYLQQMVAGKPLILVTYYVSLYGTLKARLRRTDLVARPSELQFAVILGNASEGSERDSPIFQFLNKELRSLQEAHGIFQADPRNPEGYRVLSYPRDRARIFKALNVPEAAPAVKRAA